MIFGNGKDPSFGVLPEIHPSLRASVSLKNIASFPCLHLQIHLQIQAFWFAFYCILLTSFSVKSAFLFR